VRPTERFSVWRVAWGVGRVGWMLTTSNQQLDAGCWLLAARSARAQGVSALTATCHLQASVPNAA